MDKHLRRAALAQTALELLPAEPRDLAVLLTGDDRGWLLQEPAASSEPSQLASYLMEHRDEGRVEYWAKRLDRLHAAHPALSIRLAGDAEYPARLAQAWDRPPMLFIDGALPTDAEAVSIVGSRTASPADLEATRAIAAAAAADGLSVVSGLAVGVDAAAHEAALSVGGHTVAVFGTGIETVFPAEHADLAQRILTGGGALVSQFAPDAPRTPSSFLCRNTVIAGLSSVSLVMSGQERSGSRQQAEQAAKLGRRVLLWGPALRAQTWAQRLAQLPGVSFVDEVVAAGERVRTAQQL
ncbi:DNA-processing protein DprA [Kineococcus aurantiacus]|uniref:DNA processing protein n=1 Tax=Kineococcus aurantiacus TaxID=37633 RepID=A0A7Y9DQW0_9ACTN|nr:DNA-processing protein DprA [Kineococcus aurantiacus]NYD25034.1 DNA processing protein [Kineococcus aurantiacus]